MGQKDNAVITAAKDAHVCYLAQVEEEGRKSHTRGPPSCHLFHAIMETILAQELKPGLRPLQEALAAYHAEYVKFDIDAASDAVPLCKLAKAYDSDTMKLQFACPAIIKVGETTTTVGSVVSRLVVACGLVRKFGKAPQGWMERSLSTVLDGMKKGK